MVVAVLSDTHNLLRQEVVSQIQSCDAVIHAGDISSQKIIDQILECRKKDAPFYVVRGNNDKEWAEDIPEFMNVTLAGVEIFLIHNNSFFTGHTFYYFSFRENFSSQ